MIHVRLGAIRAICVFALLSIGLPAQAFDLARAEQDGRLVAQALSRGERGDWAGAQALVANSDQLVRDIVVWRKLRKGAGSVQEFNDFASRRPDWPGQDILRSVVLRTPRPATDAPPRPALSGGPAASYRDFDAAVKGRDWSRAENLLLSASASQASLGVPAAWAGRRLDLARKAAREGRGQAAYRIASQHHMTPQDGYIYSDSEWVAGWVALTMLKDPAKAITHFTRFRQSVDTPISVGRGGYWLGRAYEAAGNEAESRRWYADGARYQTTFYGQLAAARIGAPGDPQLTVAELPDWRTHPAMNVDDVRLAAILYFAGEDSLAMQTFQHLGEKMPAGGLAPLTSLVLDLGQQHYAVRISKQAAGRGVLIYPAYYPLHDLAGYATKIEPALALSLTRQETEMNPRAVSRAGAKGLMQLMPETAKRVASWIGEPFDEGRLLSDWHYNVRLGETYLSRRTAQFGGSYAMAAAAYNAGAGRVDQWVAAFGDPRSPQVDIVDWIEKIPFDETRNYVQRVMEGLYVYRSRLSGKAGPMTIEQDLARGRG